MVKKILSWLMLLTVGLLFVNRSAGAGPREITVSAAISLKDAFEELGRLFEAQNSDSKVFFNFGASGDLTAQLRGGAPMDVFAAAALKDMDALDGEGLIVRASRVNFASNAIVLVRPASSKVLLSSFEDLKKPGIRKIAFGNPLSTPAGRYADEVFRYFNLAEAIKDKAVPAENVRQVLDYVARNEVDAGVVYSTDAKTRPGEVLVVSTAPEGSHKPVLYPIGVVKGSKNEKTARAFISFVRSGEAVKALEKYGFKPVK